MALGGSTSEATEKQKNNHGHVHREVRDLVSAITGRLTNIHHKVGPGHDVSDHHHQHHDDSDSDNGGGIRIVTLTGTNAGATMRGDLDHDHDHHGGDAPSKAGKKAGPWSRERGDDMDDAMKTYVNSNFQAVNNSIMMGGSYSANDPGVHLDISDLTDNRDKGKLSWKRGNNKNKNKKKNGKEGSKPDGTSPSSSSSSESTD